MTLRRAQRTNLTNVRRGLRGLGCLSTFDMEQQMPGGPYPLACTPGDDVCANLNTLANTYATNFPANFPNNCVPDGTPITFDPRSATPGSNVGLSPQLAAAQAARLAAMSGGAANPVWPTSILPASAWTCIPQYDPSTGMKSGCLFVQNGSASAQSSVSPGSAVPTASSASLSFSTSRGGNVLQAGDTWQLAIAGAAPSAPVSVTGGQNGNVSTTPMGTTDAAGTFSLSGQITASQAGSWTEQWTVGGSTVGSFSFTVVASAAAPSSATAATPTASSSIATSSTSVTTTAGSSIFGFAPGWGEGLSSIPTWVYVAGAVGLGLLFMSGGSR